MIKGISEFIKNTYNTVIKYLNKIGILTLTLSIGSGIGLFIFLKIGLKLLGRKINFKPVKKELNRIVLAFSLMLSFSLSKFKFLERYGIIILWIIIVFYVYKISEYLIVEYYLISKKSKYIPKIIRDIIKGAIVAVLVLILLKVLFNFSLQNIAITSAVVTGVLAFALQDTFVNLIAGISISIEKPFKIGDWIKVRNDIVGEVIQTSWRTTRLLTLSRDLYIIPNREISNNEFFNFYKPKQQHGIVLKIGVSYNHPPNEVKRIIKEILTTTDGVCSDPEPFVTLVAYNDFSMDYEIRYWVEYYPIHLKIHDTLFSKIWYYFKREEINIPFPIRTLQFDRKKKDFEKQKHDLDMDLFRKCPIFENFNDTDMEKIANNFERLPYGKDETVIQFDDEGSGLYILEQGQIAIYARDSLGNSKFVKNLEIGDFFGELSLLTGAKTKADVTAKEDSILYRLKREKFKELTQDFPSLLTQLSDLADKRLNEMLKFEEIEEVKDAKKDSERKTILKKLFDYFEG